MSASRPHPKSGETYETPDATCRIWVRRVASTGAWADVVVTQPNGASWKKRQPLRDGAFLLDCHLVGGAS